jgi:hypothetical protein
MRACTRTISQRYSPFCFAPQTSTTQELAQATQQIKQAVDQVQTLKSEAQEGVESRGSPLALPRTEMAHATQQVEQAVERAEAVLTDAGNEAHSEEAKGEAPSSKLSGSRCLREPHLPQARTHGGASHSRGGTTVP